MHENMLKRYVLTKSYIFPSKKLQISDMYAFALFRIGSMRSKSPKQIKIFTAYTLKQRGVEILQL